MQKISHSEMLKNLFIIKIAKNIKMSFLFFYIYKYIYLYINTNNLMINFNSTNF